MSHRFKDLKQLAKEMASKNYNKPNIFKAELEDHINASLSSSNKLGRFLDPAYGLYFDYPGLGSFRSPLNLIYWLRDTNKNDLLRGLKRKDLNKVIFENKFPALDNHQAILLKAMEIRLRNRPDLIEFIRGLPDDIEVLSYKVHPATKIRITTGYASIVVPVVEELIKAVKEDRNINYDAFVTKKTNSKVPFVTNMVSHQEKTLEEVIDEKGKKLANDVVAVELDDTVMTVSPEGISFGKEVTEPLAKEEKETLETL